MTTQTLRAESARDNIIPFNVPPRVRNDVPPFDPSNPAHLRAWESLYDMGKAWRTTDGN